MNYFTKKFRKGSLYGPFWSYLFLIMLFQLDGISYVHAQIPAKQWDKTYGGSSGDDFRSHIKTNDGGFLLGGNSTSNLSGDKSENSKGGNDYWIIKLDVLGNKIWDKTYGGGSTEFFVSMINTSDDGFLIWGHSESNMGGDKSENSRGGFDWWILKLDALGNKIWDKTIGGNNFDYLSSVLQTPDGGYYMAGHSSSNISGEKSQNSKGGADGWVVRLDAVGNKIWDKTLGGSSDDYFRSIVQAHDGGYAIGALSSSNSSGDKTENSRGSTDFWLVKIDPLGTKVWDKTYGGNDGEGLERGGLIKTTDGGYVFGGYSSSNISGDKTENSKGGLDYWIVKVDGSGNFIWDKTYGGIQLEWFYSILQTTDNGFLIGGFSNSGISGDKTENSRGGYDYWILKLDQLGLKTWDKSYGGSLSDQLYTISHASDGGYLLGGSSPSNASVDKSENSKGIGDYWVVKLGPESPPADTIPPDILNLPDTLYLNNDPGLCSAQVSWMDPEVTDSGGVALIQSDYSSGDTFPVGATTITYTAQDSSGNTALASFVIVVSDNEAPVVSTQNITVYLNDSGYVQITPMDIDFGSADNCGIASFQLNNTYFDINSPDHDSVYLTVTDIHGNQATLGAIVMVIKPDTTAPVIHPSSDTLYARNDAGFCSAQVSWLDPEVTDSGGVALIQSDYSSGDTFPVGATTVTYTAQDSSGNTAMASFVIIVSDNESPVVATQDITVHLNDSGYAMITPMDIDFGSTDNCGIASFQLNNTYFDMNSPDYDSVYLTVTDIHGNQATLGAIVTVVKPDTIPPVIVILNDSIFANTDPGLCSSRVTWVEPEIFDESGYGISFSDFHSGDSFPVGSWTVTYTAFDSSGNMSTASFVILVSDQEAPVVLTKEVTIYLNDSGYADITAMDIENGSTDNCGIAGFRLSRYRFDCSSPGQDSVQLTVTDIYGNEASAGAAVIILDTLSPEWVTGSGSLDRQIYCGDSAGLAESQSLSPVATDNCGMVTLFKTSGDLMGNTYTNTWVAQDARGNVSEVLTQIITLINLSVDASASSNPVELGTDAFLSAQVHPAIAGIEVNFYLDEILAGTAITNGSGTAQLSVPGLSAGVYKIRAFVGGGCAESIAYLPVYDPDGGFVTGGGWIFSPAGAYAADPLLTGKANFGFVSKYKKGSNEVDGNTEFQFKAGNLNFKSSGHITASLVIAGAKAIYKGVGTVNGAGNYGFMVSAIDGQVNGGGNADKFRIKIWDKNQGNGVIYDNQMGADENADASTQLGGGSIVIHKPGKNNNLAVPASGQPGLRTVSPEGIQVEVYPNPVTSLLQVRVLNPDQVEIHPRMIDVKGQQRPLSIRENSSQGFILDLTEYPAGLYFLQLKAGENVQSIKVLKQD